MKKILFVSLLFSAMFFGGCLRIPEVTKEGLQATSTTTGTAISGDQEIIGNEAFTEADKKEIETNIEENKMRLKTEIDSGYINLQVEKNEMFVVVKMIVLKYYTSTTGKNWKVGDTARIKYVKKDGKLISVAYENGKLVKSMSSNLNKNIVDALILK